MTGGGISPLPARAATAMGFIAILLWSTLATLTALKGPQMPPFQTTALTFAIGGCVLTLIAVVRGRWRLLRPRALPFLLAVYGLFVYHALYFAALRLAPAAEANLLASLWALLTVLLSGLLPGHRLHARHLVAAVMGLAAATLLIRGGVPTTATALATSAPLLGFGLALACAAVWSTYSVLSRLVADSPSESLAIPCLVTSLLSLICHLGFETWVTPTDASSWAALVLLGLGPVGAAFFLWDIGMKHGNIAALGVLAYASPVISTLLLVAAGLAAPSLALVGACVLMIGAAALVVR